MPVFDQRGQHVTYQYNAAGDINFGAVQNKLDVIGQLENLQAEFDKAVAANVFDEDTATDAEYQLKKAVQQAKKPEPDKKSILDHLNQAKALIEGVAAAGGMVTALVQAAEVVRNFF
jgi:hypothetical protein